jgi:hypothetical protein
MTEDIKNGFNTFGTRLHKLITCPVVLPQKKIPEIQKAGLNLRAHTKLPVLTNNLPQFLQSAASHFPD